MCMQRGLQKLQGLQVREKSQMIKLVFNTVEKTGKSLGKISVLRFLAKPRICLGYG